MQAFIPAALQLPTSLIILGPEINLPARDQSLNRQFVSNKKNLARICTTDPITCHQTNLFPHLAYTQNLETARTLTIEMGSVIVKTFRFLTSAQVMRLYQRTIATADPSQPAMLESAVASPMNAKYYEKEKTFFSWRPIRRKRS